MGGPGSGPRPDAWRRRRVAELRARGLTLPEIGRRFGLSKQLVHYYVRLAGGPAATRRVPDVPSRPPQGQQSDVASAPP